VANRNLWRDLIARNRIADCSSLFVKRFEQWTVLTGFVFQMKSVMNAGLVAYKLLYRLVSALWLYVAARALDQMEAAK
jgi:hypothetical protein